jgi:hypothetical protein
MCQDFGDVSRGLGRLPGGRGTAVADVFHSGRGPGVLDEDLDFCFSSIEPVRDVGEVAVDDPGTQAMFAQLQQITGTDDRHHRPAVCHLPSSHVQPGDRGAAGLMPGAQHPCNVVNVVEALGNVQHQLVGRVLVEPQLDTVEGIEQPHRDPAEALVAVD